jgi:hypothetical protein
VHERSYGRQIPGARSYEEALAIYQQFAKTASDAYNESVKWVQDRLESMPK